MIVNLVKYPDQTFHIGDKVKLFYDGKIKDKAPSRLLHIQQSYFGDIHQVA
ncbi:hypothetical protein [Lysinibacillus zambalensis]|uniref:hypothetical protein n=1 Tax=Lysinibacillus zambalensis TaxID=3160866 RepID=UPI0032E3D075